MLSSLRWETARQVDKACVSGKVADSAEDTAVSPAEPGCNPCLPDSKELLLFFTQRKRKVTPAL